MPFSLQSSGDKGHVLSQVNGQITGSYNVAPVGQDREDSKARMEKIRDYLFNDLAGEFPNESPVGLVLIGDAGKDYISITRLEFSVSRPAKPADTVNNPVPVKEQAVEAHAMNPPAPDKGAVPEANTSATNLAASSTQPPQPPNTNPNPTTPAPHLENAGLVNPQVPGEGQGGSW